MHTDGHGFPNTWQAQTAHLNGEPWLEKNIRVYPCSSVVSFLQLPVLGSFSILAVVPRSAAAREGVRAREWRFSV